MVTLTDRTRGPARYGCTCPDSRDLSVHTGEWESVFFYVSRCGRRRCRSSDHDRRLDHCVDVNPSPKNGWVGGLVLWWSGKPPSRVRLGDVAYRIPGTVEVDVNDTLRECSLSTPRKCVTVCGILGGGE